jgi:ketosteroid isomerase-like protein
MKLWKVPSTTRSIAGRARYFSLFLLLSLTLASTASAQKKKKKDDTAPAPAPASQLPDDQQIDNSIGEMLGAWQLGDIDKLHSKFADDVDNVNGGWAQPLIGWASYLASYQAQRARVQQTRMDRSNTLIRVAPGATFAWACYQWEFTGIVDGAPSSALGQTTLVFEKRNGVWLIVHNHTSLVQPMQTATPTPQAPAATPPRP